MTKERLNNFLKRLLKDSPSLLERKQMANITILITYRCFASCAHCVFSSSPKRREQVEFETAKNFIDAASRFSPKPAISFSGGDPFFYPKKMRELMIFASDRGMISEAITSAAWCKDEKKTEEMLSDFRNLGLKTFCISYDRFHEKFVQPQLVVNGIRAALKLGLRVCVNSAAGPDFPKEKVEKYLRKKLNLKEVEWEKLDIAPNIPAPVGRALKTLRGKDYLYTKGDLREGCPFPTEIITLTPAGYIYPCCGMIAGATPKKGELFCYGPITNLNVNEVYSVLMKMQRDLFLRLLQALGPYRILLELNNRNARIKMRKKYVGNCDVCDEFMRNRLIRSETKRWLEECALLLR